MSRRGRVEPTWREDVPPEGTYRALVKYDPAKFKHPSAAWVEMFRRELGSTDEDFRVRRPGGDAGARGRFAPRGQRRVRQAIVARQQGQQRERIVRGERGPVARPGFLVRIDRAEHEAVVVRLDPAATILLPRIRMVARSIVWPVPSMRRTC